jgi:predicted  nucleic acid-binding Zn-ribbon protein
MPHQCVRCGTFYSDGAEELLQGCSCGKKVFFYIKKSQLKKAQELELTEEQKNEIEESVEEIAGLSQSTDPVILDFEAINVIEPGKFEIDLVNLLNKEKPIVYKLEEGKYMIDLGESFKREEKIKK